MKQAKILVCPHEGCDENHLLKPGEFRVVRGETGRGAKTYKPKFYAEDREWARAVKMRDSGICLKMRDSGICRKCGEQGHDAAHIFSRRYKATRHVLLNGVTLCRKDHAWAHANPAAFEEWAKEEIGSETFETLRAEAHSTAKRVP